MSTAVFAFGRFNPPTIGHEKLVNAVIAVNQREGGTALVYGSHSQDNKKNPLSHIQKFKYLKKMFARQKRILQSNSKARTILEIAVELSGKHNKLILIAGSDRVSEFKSLLNSYNGKKAKHGFYEFEEIDVIRAGERDPDADGASGMSASKMRLAATQSDFESFLSGASSEGRFFSYSEAISKLSATMSGNSFAFNAVRTTFRILSEEKKLLSPFFGTYFGGLPSPKKETSIASAELPGARTPIIRK